MMVFYGNGVNKVLLITIIVLLKKLQVKVSRQNIWMKRIWENKLVEAYAWGGAGVWTDMKKTS